MTPVIPCAGTLATRAALIATTVMAAQSISASMVFVSMYYPWNAVRMKAAC
jgi:hypothetical protein